MLKFTTPGVVFPATCFLLAMAQGRSADMTAYSANPFVVKLDIPAPKDSAGALIVADLTGNGSMDYRVSVPGHVAACANDGRPLWTRQIDIQVVGKSETHGLPGHHGSGLQSVIRVVCCVFSSFATAPA